MSEDVLLRFLGSGLIDVGGDDTKLEKLRVTASDLAGSLKKSSSKALAYALIAFDPQAPVDDPVVVDALDALKKRWATYVNTFSGPPVAVVRAMLLDALAQAAADDDRIGVAVVASARNALPFMEAGDEREIWADVVTEIEERVDARAETEWATPSSIAVPPMVFDVPELKAPTVTTSRAGRDYLKKEFRAAAGPQFQDPQRGNVATNGNPYWPGNNHIWVTEFGDRMAEAVAESIDAVVGKTRIEQADLSDPFRELAATVSGYVGNALNTVTAATAGLQRRTNLLWWKETLFSPTTRVSYRDLPPAPAATLMAFDLHQQVPMFSPASVAAFLSEAVVGLPSIDQDKTYPMRELVAEAQTEAGLAVLRTAGAALIGPPEGRGPFLALIAYPDVPVARAEAEFRRLTGVPPDAQLTLPAWASWVFRELQAARAAKEGSNAKRRTRRS
ncbi:GTPase-associated system all-helical protein GASH [Micromonospora sp. NPDC049301]|uniref:GTPase-associated system all-helical protein GASH n=1 Tax=Micromonospora sp. NPDC049301 TaxID=3155723 RepID=UPI0034192C62